MSDGDYLDTLEDDDTDKSMSKEEEEEEEDPLPPCGSLQATLVSSFELVHRKSTRWVMCAVVSSRRT
jgi:hypothetical protein